MAADVAFPPYPSLSYTFLSRTRSFFLFVFASAKDFYKFCFFFFFSSIFLCRIYRENNEFSRCHCCCCCCSAAYCCVFVVLFFVVVVAHFVASFWHFRTLPPPPPTLCTCCCCPALPSVMNLSLSLVNNTASACFLCPLTHCCPRRFIFCQLCRKTPPAAAPTLSLLLPAASAAVVVFAAAASAAAARFLPDFAGVSAAGKIAIAI